MNNLGSKSLGNNQASANWIEILGEPLFEPELLNHKWAR
jgi:hypothetical protein